MSDIAEEISDEELDGCECTEDDEEIDFASGNPLWLVWAEAAVEAMKEVASELERANSELNALRKVQPHAHARANTTMPAADEGAARAKMVRSSSFGRRAVVRSSSFGRRGAKGAQPKASASDTPPKPAVEDPPEHGAAAAEPPAPTPTPVESAAAATATAADPAAKAKMVRSSSFGRRSVVRSASFSRRGASRAAPQPTTHDATPAAAPATAAAAAEEEEEDDEYYEDDFESDVDDDDIDVATGCPVWLIEAEELLAFSAADVPAADAGELARTLKEIAKLREGGAVGVQSQENRSLQRGQAPPARCEPHEHKDEALGSRVQQLVAVAG